MASKLPRLLYGMPLATNPIGRPKRGKKIKELTKKFIVIDRNFCLKLVNLKTDDEIKAFLDVHHFFTIPDEQGNPIKASLEDIKKFGIQTRTLLKNKAMLESTHLVETINYINKNLKYCHPQLIPQWWTNRELSDTELEEFHSDLRGIENKPSKNKEHDKERVNFLIKMLVMPAVRRTAEKIRKGGIFNEMVVQCSNTMSGCCYFLIAELLKDEFRLCANCSRLFLPKNQRLKYCLDKTCKKERLRSRVRKHRKTSS